MTDRILDFSQSPARLSIRNGLLLVERHEAEPHLVPLGDLAAVIVSHPQVTFTLAVLGQFAAAGLPLVVCDEKHRPSGMLLPLESHGEQSGRFRKQAELSEPRRKRIWQRIVMAKIQSQGRVLEELLGSGHGLDGYARRVRSGDTGNVEAHAARRYWALLFPERDFRRANEDDPRNHLLNYGYAIVRSAAARGICACGLHPAFGLHHRHRYNTFPLADDLMEPFRPAIDRAVALMEKEGNADLRLDPTAKKALLGAVTARYTAEGESRTLLDWITRTCQRLASSVCGDAARLDIPAWHPDPASEEGAD